MFSLILSIKLQNNFYVFSYLLAGFLKSTDESILRI